ncbi:MAG: hypothetical protein HY875_04805 [Chloroflexi bacterium]|nr:hypothetical protein [Chloroflexota bacterium]
MRWLVLVVAVLGSLAATVAACGGGDPDREELDRLRAESEFLFDDAEREALLVDALAVAARNAGKPLGDEAFAFAEDAFLEWYVSAEGGLFSDRAPAPASDVSDLYLETYRSLFGFTEATPAPYRATAVVERLRDRLLERAGHYLFRLDEAVANRAAWVSELQTAGTTSRSFQGQESEDGFAEYGASLRYLRDLASRAGMSGDFLVGWDRLVAAVAIADYAPPSVRTEYRDGKIVTTYTAEAVAAGAQNVKDLGAAIAAAKPYFPEAGN